MHSSRGSVRRGQSTVEYILVTALVALAAVGIFKAFRSDLSEAYRNVGRSLIDGVRDPGTGETAE